MDPALCRSKSSEKPPLRTGGFFVNMFFPVIFTAACLILSFQADILMKTVSSSN
jgi:hypothetical protein